MSRMILITGGCRSGKSRHAQHLAEDAGRRRLYIATAPILDAEMEQRVARHQEERRGRGWDTSEEPLDLSGALNRGAAYEAILCDCLSLWVSNLMYSASQRGGVLRETHIVQHCREVCAAVWSSEAAVFFVTNEVGMGIVPENPVSRQFRDLAGRCNQEMSAAADQVIFMVSGLPLPLKG